MRPATLDYAASPSAATSGARVAIEQFDASAGAIAVGFGDGWHEQEFNPRTGVRWRWLSERGELRVSRDRATSTRWCCTSKASRRGRIFRAARR